MAKKKEEAEELAVQEPEEVAPEPGVPEPETEAPLDAAVVEEERLKAKAAREKADAQAAWEDKRRRSLVSDLGEIRGTRIFEREKEGGFKTLWPHPAAGK